MAKVHYVQGRYRDAQGMCARVGLEELTREDQPTYHLRLLAEAFVIKGSSSPGFAQDGNLTADWVGHRGLASRESTIQLKQTRQLERSSGPGRWFVIKAGGAQTGRLVHLIGEIS